MVTLHKNSYKFYEKRHILLDMNMVMMQKTFGLKLLNLYMTSTDLFFQIKRSQIRKGMVMVSPAVNPSACWEFEGEILVLHHPTTISSRYQAMGKSYSS